MHKHNEGIVCICLLGAVLCLMAFLVTYHEIQTYGGNMMLIKLLWFDLIEATLMVACAFAVTFSKPHAYRRREKDADKQG